MFLETFGARVFIKDVVWLVTSATVQTINPFEKETGKPGGMRVQISAHGEVYVIVRVCRE